MLVDPISKGLFKGAGARPVVLMYHATPSRGKGHRWALPLRRFLGHLDLLSAEGWRTATVSDLASGRVGQHTIIITFDDGYADNLRACEALAKRNMCATWFLVSDRLGRRADWRGGDGGLLMDEQEVRELHAAGMEIGSHTRNHRALDEIQATELLVDEVTGSRRALEDMLGQSVDSFAYPYGRLNEAAVKAVRAAGYLAACTCQGGVVRGDADLLRLPRLEVDGGCGAARLMRMIALATAPGDWGQLAGYYWRRLWARFGR